MKNNVIGYVLGGSKQVFDGVSTVGDVATKLGLHGNYSAAINGITASFTDQVSDGALVTFTQAVKGGSI